MKTLQYIGVLLALSFALRASAAVEQFVNTNNGVKITTGTLSVTDPYHSQLVAGGGSASSLFRLNSSEIAVKFYFDDALRTAYTSNWTVTVIYKITIESASGMTTGATETLSIAYDPSLPYTDMVMKKYTGNQATVKIISISGLSPIPNDIYMDLECTVDRDYVMSPVPSRVRNTYSATDNTLKLDWLYIKGAEWYELEYLFVDYGTETLSTAKDFDFANATRVTLGAQTYTLHMAYPRGKLLYRVRGVGNNTSFSGDKIYSNWSYEPSPGDMTDDVPTYSILGAPCPQYFDYNGGFEPGINWEYAASFSEEGKRTDHMSYMDGLMRGRQQVMINQQENRPVAAETVYDFVGRPAVQFMPAPVKSTDNNGLSFYDDLNQATYTGGQAPYDYRFFDTDSKTGTPDGTSGSVSSGASFYYSGSNTNDPGFNGAYIPDADDYPFVRTQYLNDGTDRVKSQSGVGEEFKPNSDHEVKILYGSPASQAEIDRLFGNEAGDVNMYSKEVVMDANGQQSVKYIDNEGRVIATALTGSTPGNLHEIDSKPAAFAELKSNLHTYNQFSGGKEWIINHSFIVAVADEYGFSYTLNGDTLCNDCITQESGIESFPHCTNCLYDVTIELIDDASGDTVHTESATNTHNVSTITFSETLSPGTYTVYKKLKLHENFVQNNLQYFLDHQSCLDLVIPDGGDCVPSCTTMCMQNISYVDPATGNTVYFITNEDNEMVIQGIALAGGGFDGDYDFDADDAAAMLSDCLETCEVVAPPSAVYPCDQEYQMLLTDMTPGGQYFDNLPLLEDPGYDPNDWLETNVSIPSEITSDCSCTTWVAVRAQWKEDWGQYMVLLHPEYCAFEKRCEGCKSASPALDHDDFKDYYSYITGQNPCFYNTTCVACTTCTVNTGAKFYNPTGITQNGTSAGIGTGNENFQPFAVPVLGTDAAYDPLFHCLDDNDRDLSGLLNQMLQEFIPVDNTCTKYYSIWYVMQDPDGIAYDNGDNSADPDVEAYFDIVHGNSGASIPGLIGTGTNQISEAEFFRRAYMLFRNKVLYNYVGKCTSPDLQMATVEDGKNADGFYVRYPVIDMFANWPDPYSVCDMDDMETSVAASTTENLCQPYIDQWMDLITANCSYTSMQLDDVEANLLAICQGSDPADFPYDYNVLASGTVTVNSVACSTFVQVAEAYGCSLNPSTIPTVPQEYDQANCVCAQLNAFLEAAGLDLNSDEDDVLAAIEAADLLETGETPVSADVLTWLTECQEEHPDYANFDDLINAFECPASIENSQDADQWASDCNAALDELAAFNATNAYNDALNILGEKYAAQIYSSCLDTGATALKERFTMTYTLQEYHYTLYYYDQAGNLVKTVSPEGNFHKGSSSEWTSILDATDLASTASYRATGSGTYVHPSHQLITDYKYNSLNQLSERTTADEGKSTYFYDYLGRLVASQNAKEAAEDKYSVVLYDELSRETMAFIGHTTTALTQATASDPTNFDSWVSSITGSNRTEITEIFYDEPLNSSIAALITPTTQDNLRNRVAAVAYTQTGGSPLGTYYDYATHYSYDIHGNVKTVVQDNEALKNFSQNIKRITYDYELVSGNVTEMKYQEGKYDQFFHKYYYDRNNMVEEVYTSKDNYIWERDADYFYQPTGQLARMEQGQRAVNGTDYAYTLQGWLKGVNSNTLKANRDIGKDGYFTASTDVNKYYGQDVMGYTIGYYLGDYSSVNSTITGTSHFEADVNGNDLFDATNTYANLFNGNIGHVVLAQNTTNSSSPTQRIIGKAYGYDQLNRLKNVETNQGIDLSGNDWNTYSGDNKFKETGVTYDGNGNIQSWQRYGSGGSLDMDDLAYNYNISSNHLTNNQLNHVDDNTGYSCNYNTDIDDQGSNNYVYNEVGQLKSDAGEHIDEILWYERGKVRMVIKDKHVNTVCSTEVAKNDVEYIYDGMGYKIGKIDKAHVASGGDLNKPDSQQKYLYTWYVNDALGNVLSIYQQSYSHSGSDYFTDITQEDVLLQGAGGMYNPHGRLVEYKIAGSSGTDTLTTAIRADGSHYIESLIDLSGTTITLNSGSNTYDYSNYTAERTTNEKQFELPNHLGSVVTVTSDRKRAYDDGTPDGTVDRYVAEINSWSDTYAFGSVATGGVLLGSEYRYGYQGSEKEPEIDAGGYSTDFRILDVRIGRWFSTDMIEQEWQTPYCSMDNNPIALSDELGLSTESGDESKPTPSGGGDERPSFEARSRRLPLPDNNEQNSKQDSKFLEAAGKVLNAVIGMSGNVLKDMTQAKVDAGNKLHNDPRIRFIWQLARVFNPNWWGESGKYRARNWVECHKNFGGFYKSNEAKKPIIETIEEKDYEKVPDEIMIINGTSASPGNAQRGYATKLHFPSTRHPKSKKSKRTYKNPFISVSGGSNDDTGPDRVTISDENGNVLWTGMLDLGDDYGSEVGGVSVKLRWRSRIIVTVDNPRVKTGGAGAFGVIVKISESRYRVKIRKRIRIHFFNRK